MNSTQFRLAGQFTIVIVFTLISVAIFAADKKNPGDMIAVVNGTVITQEKFDRGLELNKRRLASRGIQIPEEQMTQFKNDVLDEIINMELLFQESEKKGIKVKPEAASDQFKEFKQRFPSEAEFNKWLEDNDFTESDFRDELTRLMAIRQLIDQEVDQKVRITDEESKTFYDTNPQYFQQPEQVRASHILIKVDEGASDEKKAEARKKIKDIQQKVQKGEDFAVLAQTYSEGPSAPKGGDLDYFGRGQMVKPFEDAAFSLKPNETSDIVETKFGYHLIKVVDKQPAKKMAYAEVKVRIDKHLKDQKVKTESQLYFDKLKKDAKIEKFL